MDIHQTGLNSQYIRGGSPRCEIKLICAVVNSKTVGGELSQLWESELMQGVMAYYEEGRNSTDPFSTEVYQAVTAGKNQGLWFVRGF